jgi:hypothetical protein
MFCVLLALATGICVWVAKRPTEIRGGSELPVPVRDWIAQHPESTFFGYRQHELRLLKMTVFRIKTATETENVIDGNGKTVDLLKTLDEERSLRYSTQGVWGDELTLGLSTASPGDTFLVSVWPRAKRPELGGISEKEYNDDAERKNRARIFVWVAAVNAPIASLLDEINAEIVFTSPTEPMTYARMTKAQLQTLQFNPLIDQIDLEHEQAYLYSSSLWRSNDSTRVSEMYAVAPNYSGNGEEIIVVESGELAVDPASPDTKWWHNYLSPGQPGGRNQMLYPGTGCQTAQAVSLDRSAQHALWVSGVASASDGVNRNSGAHKATIFLANSIRARSGRNTNGCLDPETLPGLASTSSVATIRRPNARIYNHSWGDDDGYKLKGGGAPFRTMDFRVRYLRTTEVHACGNSGKPSILFMRGLPVGCRELNTIHVGGYYDRGTSWWSDDELYSAYNYGIEGEIKSTGSWFNGFGSASDRELPELAAPAALMGLLETDFDNNNPSASDRTRVSFNDHTGTSFAAPRVSGLVASMHARMSLLKSWPMATKAVLMATALNNVQGQAIPKFSPRKIGSQYTADLRIGAGGVSGFAITRFEGCSPYPACLSTHRAYVFLKYAPEPFSWVADGQWQRYRFDWQLPVYQGRVRVVLAWNGTSECFICSDVLSGDAWGLLSDLDLEILDANGNPLVDANGQRVGLSISFDNNYEIVDLDMRGYAQPLRVRVKGYPPFRRDDPFALAYYQYESVEAESPPKP